MIRTVEKKENIYSILQKLSPYFYNQSVNCPERIESLSKKFSQYAVFRCVYKKGIPCGFAAFYVNDIERHVAFLSMIVVDRSFQKQGIGKTLLADVVNICRKEKMKYLDLEVDDTNKQALHFYASAGFKFKEKKSTTSSIYEFVLNNEGEKTNDSRIK